MAKTIVRKRRVARRGWTRADVKELRQHSKDKTRVTTISRALKRTPGALEKKGPCTRDPTGPSAHQEKMSLTLAKPNAGCVR